MKQFFRRKLPTGYHEQTYASPYWIVRYPHQKRLSTAVDSMIDLAPRRVLDYGAGDGKLLVEALAGGLEAEQVVAFEPVERFWRQLQEQVEQAGVADRVTLVTDRADLANYSFDYIACLSVLEHMPLLERQAFYDVCEDTLDPAGVVVIDVPVEIGPSLFVKALGRMVLKGRQQEYPWPSLMRYGLGASMYDPARFDPSDDSTWIHNHKGFDYRLLRREIEYRFDVTDQIATPLRHIPAPLGNQEVFFVVRRRDSSRHTSHTAATP